MRRTERRRTVRVAWRMRLGVALVAHLLLASPASALDPPRQPRLQQGIAADFELAVETPGRAVQHTAGRWLLASQGTLCVRVASPLRQELRVGERDLRLWFPERRLLLRRVVKPGSAPPVFDALVAGLVDATQILPAQAELVAQGRTGAGLQTTWRIKDATGAVAAELSTTETQAGMATVELRDGERHVLRSYRFSGRTRVGVLTVPARIEATYRTPKGRIARVERWQLSHSTRLPAGEGVLGDCAQPSGPVQEQAW